MFNRLMAWLAGVTLWLFMAFSGICDETLRDPTRPLHYQQAKSAAGELVLQAVYSRGESRTAIVNGRVVKVGSELAGAKITRIEQNVVYYVRNGDAGVLSLRPKVSKVSR